MLMFTGRSASAISKLSYLFAVFLGGGIIRMDLKPCPFCGGKPEVNTIGTQADITCTNCGDASVGVQIVDLIPREERHLDGWNEETLCYGEKWRQLAEKDMAERWNERHITGLEEIIRQAYFIGLKDAADKRPADQPYF